MSLRETIFASCIALGHLRNALAKGTTELDSQSPIWTSVAFQAALAQRSFAHDIQRSFPGCEEFLTIAARQWKIAGEFSAWPRGTRVLIDDREISAYIKP